MRKFTDPDTVHQGYCLSFMVLYTVQRVLLTVYLLQRETPKTHSIRITAPLYKIEHQLAQKFPSKTTITLINQNKKKLKKQNQSNSKLRIITQE